MTPAFSPVDAAWLEMGGVYAVANMRGGGEYGEAWHEAGMLAKKQNVFDDFIAARRVPDRTRSTHRRQKLAIQGGSNGGLLVGAVDDAAAGSRSAVALPAVGVMDMLRYQKFTSAAAWAAEYGIVATTRRSSSTLYAYSPLHNIKPGTSLSARR